MSPYNYKHHDYIHQPNIQHYTHDYNPSNSPEAAYKHPYSHPPTAPHRNWMNAQSQPWHPSPVPAPAPSPTSHPWRSGTSIPPPYKPSSYTTLPTNSTQPRNIQILPGLRSPLSVPVTITMHTLSGMRVSHHVVTSSDTKISDLIVGGVQGIEICCYDEQFVDAERDEGKETEVGKGLSREKKVTRKRMTNGMANGMKYASEEDNEKGSVSTREKDRRGRKKKGMGGFLTFAGGGKLGGHMAFCEKRAK